MREIKFRFTFKNGNFIAQKFRTLDEILDDSFPLEKMIEDINCDSSIYDIEDYPDYEIFKDEFTNMKDKDEEDLYKGDIVQYGYNSIGNGFISCIREIIQEPDGRFCMGGEQINSNIHCTLSGQFKNNIKKVGNKYENPELLINN